MAGLRAPPRYRWVGQLGRQAGCSAPVLLSTLFCFSNFMKKEGEVEQLGRGQLEDIALPTRGGGQVGRWEDEDGWGWVEGERMEMMKEGDRSGNGSFGRGLAG